MMPASNSSVSTRRSCSDDPLGSSAGGMPAWQAYADEVITFCDTSRQLPAMECVSCQQNAHLAELPARDRISLGDYWRVAHAWSALPGWLVVISTRHIVELAELSADEATELGFLLQRTSVALRTVIGCKKTYIAQFGEQSGFEHLHVHIVPRMEDFDKHHLGAGVFEFLKRPETVWVSVQTRDRLALELAEVLHLLSDLSASSV